jgi:hypothetical protein
MYTDTHIWSIRHVRHIHYARVGELRCEYSVRVQQELSTSIAVEANKINLSVTANINYHMEF